MLNRKRHYLQVAFNSSPSEAEAIIATLPVSDRIIVEAGTPLIKDYGSDGIARIYYAWRNRILFSGVNDVEPYVVADLKCMDRGVSEAEIARSGHAGGATVLGLAPVETINAFIAECEKNGIDSMVDMMNVEQPYRILAKLKKLPKVVVLHRGVDEETYNKDKPLPYIQINKIRSTFNVMIAMAGGDTIREVQRAIFNDANIVVVWKDFYEKTGQTGELAEEFLKEIK